MDKQQEFVLRTLEERDIRFVRLWFTDVLGFLKSVAVAPFRLEAAFAEGIGFDGSAIEGFARVVRGRHAGATGPVDVPSAAVASGSAGTARMFCDILMPDGSPSYADPRHVLKRTLGRPSRAPLFTPPRDRVLPVQGAAEARRRTRAGRRQRFLRHPHGIAHDFRREAITMLEDMSISVEFSHHEGAPGQQEIDLRYADALTTADNLMTFRVVAGEVAPPQGVYASFMPKPFTQHPGSGMHPPVALRGRQQRVPRSRGAVPAVQDRSVVHRRAARARPGAHGGHQPMGQLVQAAGRWR